jgi:hypothetical protein
MHGKGALNIFTKLLLKALKSHRELNSLVYTKKAASKKLLDTVFFILKCYVDTTIENDLDSVSFV